MRDIIKKIFVFLLIFLSFFLNLYIYNQNQEEINHFKPYYAKSYLFAAEHKVLTLKGESANAQNVISNAESLPVLVYHGVVEKPDGVSTNIDNFKNQMFELKKEGYKTVRMDDFYQYILGNKTLPDKSFMITFDDGRKDSYYPVDPILQELNYSAVMFVITGTLENKTNNFHLISSEVQRMITTNRWDIEVHTSNGHGTIPIDSSGKTGHFFSNKKWLYDQNRVETDEEFKARVSNDLSDAKKYLSNKYKLNPVAFAFPFGDYGSESSNYPNAKQVLSEQAALTFPLLFYQTDEEKGFSLNSPTNKDPMIKRINISSDWKSSDLLKVMKKSKEKDFPINLNSFNSDQGWIRNWGSVNYRENKLSLSANEEINGASVFLDGTSSWKNYLYAIDVNNSGQDVVSLIFNYHDDANYMYFSYFNGVVKLIKKTNNQDTIIATSNTTQGLNNENLIMSVIINGNNIKCLLNDKIVIDSQSESTNGGIGVMVWNENNKSATMSVNSVRVEGNNTTN